MVEMDSMKFTCEIEADGDCPHCELARQLGSLSQLVSLHLAPHCGPQYTSKIEGTNNETVGWWLIED